MAAAERPRRFRLTGPRLLGAMVVLALAIALYFALRTPPLDVEVGEVTRGPMTVTIDDLGETRVRDLYVVAAPTSGQSTRVQWEPGDRIAPGSVVARILPATADPIDARTVAQVQANIRALEAQVVAARDRQRAASAERELAERQLARTRELAARGFASRALLDQAMAARDRSRAAAAEATDMVEAARQNLATVRASIDTGTGGATGRGAVTVRAPVGGVVLQVPQESERVVLAGTPLMEIGDPAQLEVVVDLLSTDAVRVRPGAHATIEDWGGDRALRGRVETIEPFGFLKVSALGVEEQRVNVIIDLTDPVAVWRRLGHGYRARVRIELWSADKVVRVPVSALFRSGADWAVFAIDARDRARLSRVRIGHLNEDVAEVLDGLSVGTRVVLHPGDRLAHGRSVRSVGSSVRTSR